MALFGILGGRSRDPDEFERLVSPYMQRLYQVALQLTGAPDRAEDLSQETLVKAFRACHRFRHGSPVMPWLVTIMRNLRRDQARSARQRREVLVDDRDLADVEDETGSALASLERSELRTRLSEQLALLPEHYALPLTLVDMQEMSYEEAAQALDVPVGTVRSRLARGRALLRRKVIEDLELSEALPRTTSRSR